jgi:hypothetical protein
MSSLGRLLPALMPWLLAGCVASQVTFAPLPTSDTALLEEGKGVVLVQVADTTLLGHSYPVSQVTLAPKDVHESDEIKFPRMSAVDAEGKSTTFFYAVLPANDYALSSLRSFHRRGDAYLSHFYPADVSLGTFTVEAGKLTDLGTLIVYIGRSGESYRYSTIRAPGASRARDVLFRDVPGLRENLLNGDAPLGWHDDGHDIERQNAYLQAVNRQIMLGTPTLDASRGTLTYPAPLGVIVKRSAEGAWSLDAFDEDVELQQVAHFDDTTLIVTEFNEAYYRVSLEAAWQRLPNIPGGQRIAFVDRNPQMGIYAVAPNGNTFDVWAMPSLEGSWTHVQTLAPELGGFWRAVEQAFVTPQAGQVRHANYIQTDDALFFVAGLDLFRYDFTARDVQKVGFSGVESIQMRNGFLTVRRSGAGVPLSVSADGGHTFDAIRGYLREPRQGDESSTRPRVPQPSHVQQRDRIRLVGHPIFIDEVTAFAVHRGRAGREHPFLVRTVGSTDVWQPTGGPLPEGCAILELASASEFVLRCVLSGEFYRSDDEGMTWTLEREVSET